MRARPFYFVLPHCHDEAVRAWLREHYPGQRWWRVRTYIPSLGEEYPRDHSFLSMLSGWSKRTRVRFAATQLGAATHFKLAFADALIY